MAEGRFPGQPHQGLVSVSVAVMTLAPPLPGLAHLPALPSPVEGWALGFCWVLQTSWG